MTLLDYTDPTSNLDSLAERPKILKEMMQQMKQFHQQFLQREQGLTKLLEDADKILYKQNSYLQTVFCDLSSSNTSGNSFDGFSSRLH